MKRAVVRETPAGGTTPEYRMTLSVRENKPLKVTVNHLREYRQFLAELDAHASPYRVVYQDASGRILKTV